jgi:hypothetical protein
LLLNGPQLMARVHDRGLIVGRLLSHGPAPYKFQAGQDASYFLKLQTERGTRTLWGKDLKRAIAESVTQPQRGDVVGARRVARKAVQLAQAESGASARSVPNYQVAHRNRWVVEKIAFLAGRARLARRVRDAQSDVRNTVRERPELLSTFLTLRGAQELAERRIADPADRARFVALVREAMTGSIRDGEPLPSVRLRQRTKPAVPPNTSEKKNEPTR